MNPRLPTDDETNALFDDVSSALALNFGYSPGEADALARRYYDLFRDPRYCESIGIPVQDDDFFFHEAAGGVAVRIHYYLGLQEDPNPRKFIEWRKRYYEALAGDRNRHL